MLVAWRRVHRRKGMRGSGSSWEESRGTGTRGEHKGLRRHDDYVWAWTGVGVGLTKNKEGGDIKIED